MARSYPLISHVDVRVRDRARACAFYDALLEPLGVERHDGKEWTSYEDPSGNHWFGFTEAAEFTPGAVRIAFNAPDRECVDRIAARLADMGARNIEPPGDEYGANYYAYFFEDPDGNKLEVKAIEPE